MSEYYNATISVVGTRKPARVALRHEARVEVTGSLPEFEVIRAGLAALHVPEETVTVVMVEGGTDGFCTNETVTVVAYVD